MRIKEGGTKARYLEIILKALLVISVLSAATFVVIAIVICVSAEPDRMMHYLRYPAISFFACGFLVFITPFVFRLEEAPNKIKIEKKHISSALSHDAAGCIAAGGYQAGFTDSGLPFQHDGYEFHLYEREGFDLHEFIAVIVASQFTDDIQTDANDLFCSILRERRLMHSRVSLLAIVCADIYTSNLLCFVRDNTNQELNSYKYSAAIIKNTREILLSNKNDGLFIHQYKRLRKLFLKLVGSYVST